MGLNGVSVRVRTQYAESLVFFKSTVQQIRLFRPMDDVINKLISSRLANFLKRSIDFL